MTLSVELSQLSKHFGKLTAVNGVNLSIHEGDLIGLVGPNGAGKTTLLRMMTGILQQSSGTVTINGDQVETQRQLIGYLPQSPNYYDWMTAEEVLDFSLALFDTDKQARKARISKTLELVGLTKARKRKVSTFSGGMKQRLGIAQAVIHEPTFLILDEPVSALDPIGRRAVLDLIESFKDKMTIIFSTHILGDAQEVCNRFCVMKDGHLVDDFYVSDKLASDAHRGMVLDLPEVNEILVTQLSGLDSILDVTVDQGRVMIRPQSDASHWESDVLSVLAETKAPFSAISMQQFSLEDYFMSLIGGPHA